jgi:hypothetical protein
MGGMSADGKRILLYEELEWMESYMSWAHESANLSRRTHSALLQHQIQGVLAALAIFMVLLHHNAPFWQFIVLWAAYSWWSYWPFDHIEKLNRAVESHEDKRPRPVVEVLHAGWERQRSELERLGMS